MNRILHWLADPSTPVGVYILRAFTIQFIPVVLIGAALHVTWGGGTATATPSGIVRAVEVVLLAPLLENLLLGGLLVLARRIDDPVRRAAIVAVPFGLLHLLGGPVGIVAFWSFFVFGLAFITHYRRGFIRGCLVSAAVHMLANLLPGLASL